MTEIATIGHSTLLLRDFIRLLETYQIDMLVDVRTMPRSRHNPQFNKESLPAELAVHAIRYRQLASLGGLRKTKSDSINTGWRNASFRGFADYMQTVSFQKGLTRLVALATTHRIAIMCAEAVPWRCHRSLIEDALVARGIRVNEILGPHSVKEHALNPMAKVQGTQLTYPGKKES